MVIQDEVVLAEALTRGDRPGRALDLAEPDGVLLLFLLRNLRRPRVMEDEAQPEPAAPEIQARIRASFERQGPDAPPGCTSHVTGSTTLAPATVDVSLSTLA